MNVLRNFCDWQYGEDEKNTDSAMITRVRCEWKEFHELTGVLTSEIMSLYLKGKVCSICRK